MPGWQGPILTSRGGRPCAHRPCPYAGGAPGMSTARVRLPPSSFLVCIAAALAAARSPGPPRRPPRCRRWWCHAVANDLGQPGVGWESQRLSPTVSTRRRASTVSGRGFHRVRRRDGRIRTDASLTQGRSPHVHARHARCVPAEGVWQTLRRRQGRGSVGASGRQRQGRPALRRRRGGTRRILRAAETGARSWAC